MGCGIECWGCTSELDGEVLAVMVFTFSSGERTGRQVNKASLEEINQV